VTFWDKRHNLDDVPPELQNKKPEEIIAALKAAEQLQKDLDAAKASNTELQEKFETQSNEFNTIKQKLTDIEAKFGANQDDQPVVDDPPSAWSDPEKFVDSRISGVSAVALASGRMTAKMYFTQQLSTRDQKIFRNYEKEVDEIVSTFAPAAQVYPQSFLNAFLLVKGRHETDIHKAESEKTDFFAETVSKGAGPDVSESNDKLTAEEEEVCRTMHYDPKKYLENRKGLLMAQSQKGAYAKFSVPKHPATV
jgi:hypothetical protein